MSQVGLFSTTDHSYGKKSNKACLKEDRFLIKERTETKTRTEAKPPSSTAVVISLKWLFIKIICVSFNFTFLSRSCSNFEIVLQFFYKTVSVLCVYLFFIKCFFCCVFWCLIKITWFEIITFYQIPNTLLLINILKISK